MHCGRREREEKWVMRDNLLVIAVIEVLMKMIFTENVEQQCLGVLLLNKHLHTKRDKNSTVFSFSIFIIVIVAPKPKENEKSFEIHCY